MLKKITDIQQKSIDVLLQRMTLQEKIGQVQCVNASAMDNEKLQCLVQDFHIGSVFVGNTDRDRLREVHDITQESKIPVIINGDFVNGVGSRVDRLTEFPQQMACSATNDLPLIQKMGEITATEGRAYGAQWTFGPVVDLCYNLQNPMMHIRTAGDKPEHVLEVSKAFVNGVQNTGYMAATAKHFPGDGIDSRDTHITTLVNNLSREAWNKTYGYIWRGIIYEGVMAIMSGHIALPFIDSGYENEVERYKGPRPATLSPKILQDFLRGELGFEGTIVTDAINMIGLGAHMRRIEYGPRLLGAGNDMLLWTKPELDGAEIEKALCDGRLSEQRLNDAVRHVLELKARVGLFDAIPDPLVTQQDIDRDLGYAQQMADESISVLRDVFHSIPCKQLKKGSRVLTVTLTFVEGVRNKRDAHDLTFVDDALRMHGFVVDHLVNPDGLEHLSKICSDYDAIFINFKYPAKYGSIRFYGDAMAAMKGSWWVENPKVVFTAFGDPYKIYDLPALQNYVAAYSVRKVSQRAVVKVWLGELAPQGKCPVDMSRYL
jgi:beta-N-acetylhexosaminidase